MIDEKQLIRVLLAEQVKLMAYIQSIVRRPALAEEVFQDVCAVAVEKREQIADEAHLRNWLRTTARQRSLTVIIKKQEQQVSLDAAGLDAMDPVWEEQETTDAALYAEALRRCVATLSPKHQGLVAKKFVQEYDYARLAAEVGRTVDSLYVTFSRIYAFLGKCIAEQLALGARGSRG